MATRTSTPLTAAQQRELANIRASWAIEGQHITDAEMSVLERVARGELDLQAAYALMNRQDTPAPH
jgi:hypothetical protein